MKKFLVPTDFSDNAENALQVAFELAEKVNGQVILVHAYKLIQRAGTFIGVEEMMRQDAEKDMAELVEKYREVLLQGVQLSSHVIKGDIVSVVSKLVDQANIDLVIMGTQGSSGLKEVFIGSMTNNVIRKTHVPVLAIPSNCKYEAFSRITLALDGKGVEDVNIYKPLLEIARLFESELSIIHIEDDGEDKLEPQVELLELVRDLSPSVHSIPADDISDAINDFAQKNKSNLICLVKRERGFIANIFHVSQTTRNVFYTELPLLILREA